MVVDSKLMLEVKAILKDFGNKYFDGDKLKRYKVTEDLNAYDEKLIQNLLNSETINRDFVLSVNGKEIFKLNEFIDMFQYKEFWQDSYTNYANKIGLTVGGKFIDECEDVVLDFPYKDTVLKAGMTKEDKQKEDLAPNEMFLNETIAKDEIDLLFDKKIFKNVKRYHSGGVQPVKEFKEDDNLIIKGNNLIALHSLRDKYAGKIKLIYIDPPYNTGSDSFLYNDKYNHSSWLTFMKNRLEIARDLLSDDGVIFVQIDETEQAYLKVLMDNIFGSSNFINTISAKMKNIAGASGGGEDKKLKKNIEYIHLFCKDISNVSVYNPIYKYTEIFNLVQSYKSSGISWKYTSVLYYEGDKIYVKSTTDGNGDEIKIFKRVNPIIKSIGQIVKEESITEMDAYYKYINKIFTTAMPQSSIRPRVMKALENESEKFNLYSIEYTPKSGKNKGEIYEQFYKGDKFRLITWLRDVIETKDDKYLKKDLKGTFWDGFNLNNLSKEGDTVFENGKKPEELIKDIVSLYAKNDDIILDFHLGSGTTAAVAHKMGLRYIGIEQMDYINTISVPRLQKVIEGEQGGISKDVNWQGGGSFIYAELFEKNTGFIKEILNAETTEDLKKTYANMIFTSDLDFRADLSRIDWSMPFKENQKLLIKIIDKNQLYFNYSEIDDSEVKEFLTDEEVAFNKNFYGDWEE